MKLFYKIFISTLVAFAIIVIFISYVIAKQQISDVEKNLIDEEQILGSFISKQVEVGYFESNWPFESLNKLSNHKGILFWWIVRDDGMIYLADDASFMGTYVKDYFPQIASISEKENVTLNRDQNYGIFFKILETGKRKWSFYLGFSLDPVSERKKQIVSLIAAISVSALTTFGLIVYFATKHFTKPINTLITGTKIVGTGDLTYRIKKESHDELGELANSFNKMTNDLQIITVSRDELLKEIRNRKRAEEEREQLILQLKKALADVKMLSGLLPICSSCKKIRDDHGYWNQVEVYISEHSEAEFTHGLCPDCLKKMYLELDKLKKEKLPDEKI